MTLISTTTLSGASTTLSSIPQTYNYLYLVIAGVTNNTFDPIYRIAPNADTNLCNFVEPTDSGTQKDAGGRLRFTKTGGSGKNNSDNAWNVIFTNYTSATRHKPFSVFGRYVNPSSVNEPYFAFGNYSSNTAITSLVISPDTQTFAGGTVLLYGVK